jgi:hypothetical protein
VKDVDAERMAASHSLRIRQSRGTNGLARIRLATGFAGQSQPMAEVSCCHGSPRLRPRRSRPFFLPIRTTGILRSPTRVLAVAVQHRVDLKCRTTANGAADARAQSEEETAPLLTPQRADNLRATPDQVVTCRILAFGLFRWRRI